MEYRTLRNSDLKVSSIVLGTAFRGELVDEMPKVVGRALDLGINIFDTGEYVRSGVITEEVVGSVIKDRRKDVILAVKQVPPAANIEVRLQRLQTDYIDLLELLPCRCHVVCQSNYPDHVDSPHYSVGDTMREAEKLVQQGRVRYLGVSRYTTAQLLEAEAALTTAEIVSNQLQYNLVSREVGEEAMPYCKQHNITIMAYSPLGAGLFWGDDSSINKDRYARYGFDTPEKLAQYRNLIQVLGELARQRHKTVAQVAMNWVLCQDIAIPITGPDTVAHIEENCGAAGWRLEPPEIDRIDKAVENLQEGIAR
jgi:aryl-alcohol dehydrogenase-like predicted oxidoreductase